MSLKYYSEQRFSDGRVLSLDNVRIKFVVDQYSVQSFKEFLVRPSQTYIESYPECFANFKYRYLYVFHYDDEWERAEYTASLGFVYNGADSYADKFSGFFDFNPNKVGDIDAFWRDYRTIKSFCRGWEIDRCDIALDIRTRRDFVYLEKDNRKYEQIAYSLVNRTEFLGLRSHIGRVKVYNKTIEAQLPYDLTRIEVTCKLNADDYYKHFPKVYDLSQNQQLTNELLSLTDTDLAILRMYWACQQNHCDDGMMIFNSLGRDKKAKLRRFVAPESCLVLVASDVVKSSIVAWSQLY